ncbi:Thiolase, C-terminal domain-containing protein [Coprinopsis sp. MPI-PUGE-AT-0042]|nr:Thiolase, C-terminal domain-containing protein [Coprinopsis sp. MPI-PUGE-AT-0042]
MVSPVCHPRPICGIFHHEPPTLALLVANESYCFNDITGAMCKSSSQILEKKDAEDCLLPVGNTSENVAADYGIILDTQDTFAARAFQKASNAQKEGRFKDEIVMVDHDDGVRDSVTKESLGKLKPAFKKDGSTHAAASLLFLYSRMLVVLISFLAVLLARRSVAKRLSLPIVGKFVTSAVVGVPPRVMGIGPAFAIPRVLPTAQISSSDVDFYKINEAFACQAVMSIQHLKIDEAKVNLNGGGIALGRRLERRVWRLRSRLEEGCL